MLANIVLCMLLAWLALTLVMSFVASRSHPDIASAGEKGTGVGSAIQRITQPPALDVTQGDGALTLATAQSEPPEAAPVL